MYFFDTHVHLDDEAFGDHVEQVVKRASDAQVERMVAIGTTADSSQRCVDLSERYAAVWAAAGIQPNYCRDAGDADWRRIADLSQQQRVVAIGETGLDHHWDFAPLDVQRHWFRRHIELALERHRPLVIHLREGKHGAAEDSCYREILQLLRETAGGARLQGIMHSFTGTLEQAAELVDLGLHISFAGMVTFKKSDSLRQVAASIPWPHLLIETDAPYLTPHPYRGRNPNEPAMIVHTATCLSQVRSVLLERLADETWNNACRLFGLQMAGGRESR